MKRIGLALLIASVSSLATACSTVEEKVQTPIAQKENVVLTEQELSDAFNGKKQTPPEVQAEVSDGLLAQIKSEQPLFNEEKHGYFRVVGDSMTPNLYEGDAVKLVSSEYIEGDFVALTVNATGEHLVKQYVDGTLVSSSASGAYYQLEDVTIHGKVERQDAQDVVVKQTLQAAAGVYVVDIAQSMETVTATGTAYDTSIHVLLSNGSVYRSYDSLYTYNYTNFVLLGTVPVSSNAVPISITQSMDIETGVGTAYDTSIHVLLSDGSIYRSYDSLYTYNYTPFVLFKTIPVSLVQPPTGGSMSVPQNRFVGRASAGTGDAEYLTASQTKQMLESTDFLYYPVGTTAASVGMVEVRYQDALTRIWRSNKMGIDIYHTVTLYNLPTSIGDLTIN